MSEVEQELLDYMNEDHSGGKKKRNGLPAGRKTEADRGRQHAPSSVYYKPNCMRGSKQTAPVVAAAPLAKGDVTAVLSLSGPVSGTESADVVSNLHAGKDFYLDSLKNNYHLSFSDDFASVMEEIEREYKEKNKLTDTENTLLVRNWQDILAVYIYGKEQSRSNVIYIGCIL